MTPERWRHIRDLLDEVFERHPAERDAFVERACAGDSGLRHEVESLIRSYEAAGTFIDAPAARLDAGAVAVAPPEEPRRIGVYRVLSPLGRGGMGVVYLARRDDDAYQQEVAIKLLEAGVGSAELTRRFRGERQILAQLRHPHIARLIDGGTTERGQPYLVMDYVDGTPIDRHCDERRLSTEERLVILGKVCSAVHFAHQNLVVHRDLKPGNVLVSEDGEPTLLDFGIAKLLAPESFPLTVMETRAGFMAMTPRYASPEQARGGAITTASDVYSLGVLLYELLTGHRPYDLESLRLDDAMRRVCEEEPVKPSAAVVRPRRIEGPGGPVETVSAGALAALRGSDPRKLRRRLAGDLDNIVLRALAKEPQRRYGSAQQLAQDIDRYLTGLPVQARKDTLYYRAGKFVRRHKIAVTAAAGVLALLLGFLLVLLVQRAEILEQRNRAARVSGYLVDIFELPDPTRARGETVTVREILDRAARDVAGELGDTPDVRAELMSTMGRSYRNLGLYDEAETLFRAALDLREDTFGSEHATVAASRHELGELLSLQGEYGEAELLLRRALAARRAAGGSGEEVVESLFRLGQVLDRRGDYGAAEVSFEEALARARRLDRPQLLAQVLDRFAVLSTRRAGYGEAEAMFREALEIYGRLHGPIHPEIALTRNNLAALFDARGEYGKAEALYREALQVQRRLFGGAHPQVATTLRNLGHVVKKRGRLDEAHRLFEEALAMGREVYRGDHPKLAATLASLADLAYDRGRVDEAERLFGESLAMRRRVLGDRHPDTATGLDRLAQVLVDKGELERAGEMYREALEITRDLLGDRHPRVAVKLNNLADLAFERGTYDEAERLYREALAISRESLPENHPDIAFTLYNLASLLEAKGDLATADEVFAEALELGRASLGEAHQHVGLMMTSWAAVKNARDQPGAAERLARGALEIFDGTLPADHAWVEAARSALDRSLRRQDRGSGAG